ncbi:gamma-glutamyltransferase family protein [Nocardioides zeae]|uniref:Transferase n=1 Tax=Nocardioides zeae TaxID=1457234 RepID=A0A6P0HGP4_9ACTN|nr:gamma-glutamyltransferase [Nocardioides zeae]NEN77474.1 transferase [Nocardioides zeae]
MSSSAAFTPPPTDLTRPTLTGSFGMAAGTHWLAAASAQSVLERGGNAFDAAVAGAFVLHAVEPHLNGPGGDLVGIVAPAGADPVVVNGQGPAPAGASIAHLRAEGLADVPGSGALAAAVPAAVEALLGLLEEHGSWELGDVLAPAIHYLEDGHPAGVQLCRTIATMREHFTDHWPDSAALWLADGRVPEPGDVVRNPTYAATLRALVAAGTDEDSRGARIRAARTEWRSGRVGRAMVAGAARPHRHSSGTDHAGVLALADLDADHVRLEEPVTLEFRGTTVHKAGFGSQGPVLLQCLAILDQLPDERLDPSTALGAHTVLEVLKLALADRDAYYGSGADPAVLAHLLTPAYAADRAALVGATASLEHRPGLVPGATPFAPPLRTPADVVVTGPPGPGQPTRPAAGVGEPTVGRHGETRGDTCHLDVVDAAGNLVALTPSGGWLQSSPTIPELGFCLGTRLQMTWLDEASPSALRPGARPRTTLSPTVLSRDGRPFAALGTPGGDQQDQWQLLYLLRLLVGGWSPQAAIDAPAFHTTAAVSSFWPRTWEPGGVVAEARLGAAVLAELRERGHVLTVAGDWTLGRISTVGRDPRSGWLFAAANPRGAQGYAAGR